MHLVCGNSRQAPLCLIKNKKKLVLFCEFNLTFKREKQFPLWAGVHFPPKTASKQPS